MQFFLINNISSENKIKAAVITAALSLCALHFAPALSSISLMFFFVCSLSISNKDSYRAHKILIVTSVLWCLSQLIFQFRFGYDPEAIRKTMLRLPLLLLPLIWCIQTTDSKRFVSVVILFTGVFHSWLGGASVLNYFAHFRFLNQMVLESKPLPLYSSVYHIEFSLIMALVCILQLSFLRYLANDRERMLMVVSLIINVVSLHILSARTGIVAFWLGLPFLTKAIQFPKWLKGPGKWLLLLIPVVLLFTIPTLRNRIINTIEDLTAVKQRQNLSDKSFGRRWEAWKVAAAVIREKPLEGVGLSEVENAMQTGFEKNKSYLPVTDRIQPHNQFLEIALQSGIIPALLFVTWLLMMLYHFIKQKSAIGLSVLIALCVSMLFESYLERQSGVAVFVVSLFFVVFTEKKE